MHLRERIQLMVELGKYMQSADAEWAGAKQQAHLENNWFEPRFIERAVNNIVNEFLDKDKLEQWVLHYGLPEENPRPFNLGLVMAGNIPLVGFHDFLCAFVSGQQQTIKASARDRALIEHLVKRMSWLAGDLHPSVSFAERLTGCEAYIATGSNHSARYFEYYFARYPHIIRKNRTSVAILRGSESRDELEKLADDVYLYFGLGCRNVTKIYVPENYEFAGLLDAFRRYDWTSDHHKYRNNYDYQLALLLLNKKFYMTNGSILLAEHPSPFSPIGVLHYEHYSPDHQPEGIRPNEGDIQTVAGKGYTPFGETQKPGLFDYADGIDTLQFLHNLHL